MLGDVISLIDIFDYENESVFFDWVHISEKGNYVIALRMSNDIIKYLETLELG